MRDFEHGWEPYFGTLERPLKGQVACLSPATVGRVCDLSDNGTYSGYTARSGAARETAFRKTQVVWATARKSLTQNCNKRQ